MRIKAVSSLVGGEVLAEPILTEKNDILIPNGTRIKPDYVPLIESLGIESVMVEDPYENYESPNSIVDPAIFDKYVEKVRRLMESHIYHDGKSLKEFEIIANDIVHDINDMPYDVIVDIKEHNSDLYEHTVMVTLLSVLVARKLKLDEKRKYNIAVGCLLHDIGLRFIVTRYKNRDFSNANPAELFEYKKHTILGYSALDEESWIAPISMKMVLSHHENMAGTGFPMKQKNKELECGMECKRICVQEAINQIKENDGGRYDNKIIKCLLSSIARYPVGTTVKTNAEEEGVVVSQTVDPENPIIMIFGNENNGKLMLHNRLNLMLDKNISILQVI